MLAPHALVHAPSCATRAPSQELLAQVPSWRQQLTLRGMAAGCVLGTLFCVVRGCVPALGLPP